MILTTLSKAVQDFTVCPEETKFMFVLPEWVGTQWYEEYIPHFKIIKRYPKGTPRIFTVPDREQFEKTNRQVAELGNPAKNGIPRYYLDPIQWPVIVIYKDIYTEVKINPLMLAHLRFGHSSNTKLQALCKISDVDLQIKTFPQIHCQACKLANARRIVLPRAPKRPWTTVQEASKNTNQGGVQGMTLETKLQTTVHQFAHLVFTDINYIMLPGING